MIRLRRLFSGPLLPSAQLKHFAATSSIRSAYDSIRSSQRQRRFQCPIPRARNVRIVHGTLSIRRFTPRSIETRSPPRYSWCQSECPTAGDDDALDLGKSN